MNNIIEIKEFIPNSYFLKIPTTPTFESIAYDSREVGKNCVFFAFNGIHTNGSLFIQSAIDKGATTVVVDKIPKTIVDNIGYLVVENTRSAFAITSSYFYDRSDKKLKIIGISGTDGKSSCSTYLYYFLKKLNKKVGLITTVYEDNGSGLRYSTNRQSTPEANILHKTFKECVNNNVEYMVLESTSHALSRQMDRLNTIELDCAIITTITSEHLELHKSIEEYVEAKCNLIRKLKKSSHFLSTTDNKHLKECLEVAKNNNTFILKRDLNYKLIQESSLSPIELIIGNKRYKSNLYLDVFITDALLAAKAASLLTDTPLSKVLNYLGELESIKGRFNIIENSLNITVIIDFAHTSDALYHIAKQLKPKNGRLIVLFGSAGERDIVKRAKMGEVASQYCDIIIITEEDSRGEPTEKIANDIKEGIKSTTTIYEIFDRKKAIQKAIDIAIEGDVLLFLGKGHETSIQRDIESIEWNEEEVVKKAIEEREKNDR